MAPVTRQPRPNLPANAAQSVTRSGQYWVQVKNTGGTWTDVIRVTSSSRASTIATRLNSIFGVAAADLDFITPSYDPDTSQYVVVWSGVTWDTNYSTTTTNMGTTYEYLYTGCYFGSESYKSKSNVTIIATVTTADIALLGLNAWEIAYQWANAIRGYVNGWNCSKDSTGTTLIANGYIPNLIPVTGNWSGSATAISATRYGTGETQPNFSTANGDIFHTCDLVVARPSNTTSTWSLNKWIKITYNNKSVVARIVDTSNIASIDLSGGGVAYALNFPGSGNVTVSAP